MENALRAILATVAGTFAAFALVLTPAFPAAAAPQRAGGRPAGAAHDAPAGRGAWHWGSFFGDGKGADMDTVASPAAVTLPGSPVIQVGSSNSTQYALLADGSLWAWGQGTHGELGDGRDQNSFTTPVQVQFPAGVRIAFIATDAMPYDTALAVDTQGNAWGWGKNQSGALCLGNAQAQDLPVRLPLAHVTTLAGANGHAVYDSNGVVYSCGSDWNGVLGDGGKGNSEVPVRVSGLNGQNVTELVSAFGNAGALLRTGQYYDWGYNGAGQLGDGSKGTSSPVPVPVALPGGAPVAQVAQGGSNVTNGQTLVMLADGSLYAWGNNAWSQLGDGGTADQASPVRVTALAGARFSAIASGGATSYGVSGNGTMYSWGDGKNGQIGDGNRHSTADPVQVMSGVSLLSSTGNDVVAAP
jgi:alpha-tubulin suppressor-like RCC1 family protein